MPAGWDPLPDKAAPTIPPGLAEGRRVGQGRFTLLRELGRGGMGVVWLARDDRLKQEVALKLLPPEVAADELALEALRQETLKSQRLAHPYIVTIRDLHEAPGEPPFILMEYVAGDNLRRLLSRQPQRCFTWEYLRPLAGQLCEALTYAHGENIIHRDLKPGNLMLDAKGRLKLADFGIAATLSDSMSRVSRQRQNTSGTLVYMSPQQMDGRQPRLADDIYSLGATLYELLTGHPPFYTGGEAAIIYQVHNVPPVPLEERLQERGLDNSIPPEVGRAVLDCLAKERDDRPQSAAEVWARLTAPAPAIPPPLLPPPADQRWTNSLGQVFVPVPGTRVLFSIWDTRVQDYQAFVNETRHEWPKAEFEQGPTHPAVRVSYEDATAFCQWLTTKERGQGLLGENQSYRLPTDAEWSTAVGLPKEEGDTPSQKDMKIKDVYPWGNQWPPPKGAGNYGSSLQVDNFEYTSPVGSFAANRFGLFDMGGNVWQWCQDWYDEQKHFRVLRGASWHTYDASYTLSAFRNRIIPGNRLDDYGFRCVLVAGGVVR